MTLKDKRLVLVGLLMVFLAGGFWTGSRYPALHEKAMMGTDTSLSGLGFATLVEVTPDEKPVLRILYTTINWTYTNVNCAVPIAQGIRAAGGRVETMLAVMVSSPTLNVIVLTMLLSLFPSIWRP